jgi:hypothetical protein
MEYQEFRAPPAWPACAEPLAQLTAAAVDSPWQVPRSQPAELVVALSVLKARRVLWESISAWEDLVADWLSTLFELLHIRNEVLCKQNAAHAHARCGV